jgi:hypothetical protein
MKHTLSKFLVGVMLLFAFNASVAYGSLQLKGLNIDPAIITAGDQVDVVIEYAASDLVEKDIRISNPQYQFRVYVAPKDSLAKEYIP